MNTFSSSRLALANDHAHPLPSFEVYYFKRDNCLCIPGDSSVINEYIEYDLPVALHVSKKHYLKFFSIIGRFKADLNMNIL